MVSPPSSKRYASGKLMTTASRTDARAIGHGMEMNSTRWTLTNGSIDRAAARQNVLPTRMWPNR